MSKMTSIGIPAPYGAAVRGERRGDRDGDRRGGGARSVDLLGYRVCRTAAPAGAQRAARSQLPRSAPDHGVINMAADRVTN
jgi:hypothetical protein